MKSKIILIVVVILVALVGDFAALNVDSQAIYAYSPDQASATEVAGSRIQGLKRTTMA